ncbi:MAG: hypothetical protein LBT88_02745 [Oscillospiraceae bacterium]|jgi:uncharacterized membrane protein YqjE|nr:hypothetical protein [Oscillospiraceae bacterium]
MTTYIPTYSETMWLFYIAIAMLALLVLALITFSFHLLKSKKNAMIDDKKEQAFLDNDTLRLVR